jgi:hypothetical protein
LGGKRNIFWFQAIRPQMEQHFTNYFVGMELDTKVPPDLCFFSLRRIIHSNPLSRGVSFSLSRDWTIIRALARLLSGVEKGTFDNDKGSQHLHKSWLLSSIFSPCRGRDKREAAGW